MRDGATVRFVGPTPRTVGERDGLGLVLSSSGEACHVKWEQGGDVTMCLTEDLVAVKSAVEQSRESSLYFFATEEAEAEEVDEADQSDEVTATAHLSSVASGVREHIVNLVLNDPILSQAMSEVGEDTMVSMILSEVSDESA